MTVETITETNELATKDGGLAIATSQSRFTPAQVAGLRQIGVEDATEADLDVFFHHCQRTGLDPFARQIYMIGRDTTIKVRVELDNGNSRVEERRVTKYTIQTGIDGYRLIGNRAARALGVTVTHDDPLWCGKEGVWQNYWPKSAGNPIAAKYVIRVGVEQFPAIVMFEEFAQYSGRGELTAMWKKMPANQLAKCAEAAAWRKAFPADFSGIDLEGTHHTVIEQDGSPVKVASNRRGLAGLRAATGIDSAPAEVVEVVDAEPEPEPAESAGAVDPEAFTPAARKKWLSAMFAALNGVDCTDRDDQLIVITALSGREAAPEDRDGITDAELRRVVNSLNEAKKDGKAGQLVTDILNRAALAEAATDEGGEQ